MTKLCFSANQSLHTFIGVLIKASKGKDLVVATIRN
jgi:hypothetical protein